MKTIDLVFPVLNEAESIRKFHVVLSSELAKLPQYSFRMIYVLDKSTDGTEGELKAVCTADPRATLVALSKRFGYQNSIMAGLDHSFGDATIMMDADLEHPPAVIGQLLEKFEAGYDVVHTRRTYRQEISFFKKFTSKLFYRFLKYISNIELSEDSDEFKLISARVVRVFQTDIKEQNLFLRGLFNWVGFNSTTVDFVSGERAGGQSKFNFKRLMNLALSGVLSFSKIPLTLAITFGMLLSAGSFLYGFYLICLRLFTGTHSPSGWTEMVVVMLFMGGIQLIFLGVIGQYVGAIFDEVKARPRYIVESLHGRTLEKR